MQRFFGIEMSAAALLTCAGLAAPMILADSAGVDSRRLGIAEGILSYCAKADPTAIPRYEAQVRRLSQGVSADALAKARQSDGYQKARRSVEDFVAKVDEHNAARVCTNGLAAHD